MLQGQRTQMAIRHGDKPRDFANSKFTKLLLRFGRKKPLTHRL